jgi:hypothetical protein
VVAAIVQRIVAGVLADQVVAFGIGLGVHLFLEQALVAGQQGMDLAALLPGAGIQHVLHVLQRRVAFGLALGVAVGGQHQGIGVALLGGLHALGQGVGGRLVPGRDPCQGGCGQRQQDERGKQRHGAERNGHQTHDTGKHGSAG